MISPQEIFNRIQENKKKQKDLKLVIKDALKSSADLQNTAEQMEKLKEKKRERKRSLIIFNIIDFILVSLIVVLFYVYLLVGKKSLTQ